MSLRDVLALPRKVLRREKERMEMTERMGDGVREIMNVQMSVCRRVKEGRKKKGGDASVSRLSPMLFFGAVSSGESSRERLFVNLNGGA